MIAPLKQWFAPPVFAVDEEKTRRASLPCSPADHRGVIENYCRELNRKEKSK